MSQATSTTEKVGGDDGFSIHFVAPVGSHAVKLPACLDARKREVQTSGLRNLDMQLKAITHSTHFHAQILTEYQEIKKPPQRT